MSDASEIRIDPVPAAVGTTAVRPIRQEPAARVGPDQHKRVAAANSPSATTGGSLRAAYAQVAVNPDTHDVVIRIRDVSTDEVLSETPSPEIEAMTKYLNNYAATMRHRRAVSPTSSSN